MTFFKTAQNTKLEEKIYLLIKSKSRLRNILTGHKDNSQHYTNLLLWTHIRTLMFINQIFYIDLEKPVNQNKHIGQKTVNVVILRIIRKNISSPSQLIVRLYFITPF